MCIVQNSKKKISSPFKAKAKKDDKQKKSKEGKKKIVWKKDNVYVHEE